ncbi:MAG: hypothetical protein ACRYGA_13745 [Janthinobacterium lividum]
MRNRDLDRAVPDDLAPDMDSDVSDIDGPEDGDGAFHDPVLRRALAHASDRAVVPMDETRESIRAFAHEAVAPSLPAAPDSARRSVLQRVLGSRGGAGIGAYIPWNAVLATVVVGAVLVWRDRQPASGTAQEKPEPTMAVAEAPSMPDAMSAPAVPSAATATAASASPASSSDSSTTAPPAPSPQPAAVPPPMISLPTLATLPVESPADATARIQMEQKLQRLEAAEAKARLAQQAESGGVPTALFPGALPKTAIPVEVPRAGRTTATPDGAGAPAVSSAGAGRVENSSPFPNFVALSQWTRLTITPAGGEGRRVARSEAGELGALVGSAALAGVGTQPLSGRVDWRIVFERNGEPLATLETAGNQIRWKEGSMPAGTGVPSGSALTSLRQALKQAQAEPASRPTAPTMTAPAATAAPAASPAPAQPETSPATSAPATLAAPAFEMPR